MMLSKSRYEMKMVGDLEEFFGRPVSQVNTTLECIGVKTYPDLPEWLRGKHSIKQLDRYCLLPFDYHIEEKGWKSAETADMVVWIVETLHKRWHMKHDGFYFEDLTEATYFKLRWI